MIFNDTTSSLSENIFAKVINTIPTHARFHSNTIHCTCLKIIGKYKTRERIGGD